MKRLVVLGLVLAVAFAAPAVAQQDMGRFAAAQSLYASARYEEALDVLDALRGDAHVDRKSVETYRSLCLLALGRGPEAESAIAAVVIADPTFRPGEAEASPRVRATFADVRRRLLPEIATSRYAGAKATYDRREWETAEAQFRLVLALIDDPDMTGDLADLRLLASGFLELSARAALPPPAAPAPSPEPLEEAPHVALAAMPVPDGAARSEPDRTPDRIYDSSDLDVVPPAVIRQDFPVVPSAVRSLAKSRGLLEVVVDDKGRVVSMRVHESIHPTYDTQMIVAARDWKYEPAMVHGQPVRFRKLIQITLAR